MKERFRSVRRFKRLKVAYIFICLCLDFIGDLPTVAAEYPLRNGQSFAQLKTSDDKLSSNSRKENGNSEFGNVLSRETRSAGKRDYIDDQNNFQVVHESLETNFDPGMDNMHSQEMKRSKGSSLIPFPRIGRSGSFDPNLIMPYPDEWIAPYLRKDKDKSRYNDESSSTLRSKSDDSQLFDISDEEENIEPKIEDENEIHLGRATNFDYESLEERQINDNGTVIPYPRLGKRDLFPKTTLNENTSFRKKSTSDSLIPQIRYGRSPSESIQITKYNKLLKQGILPYPRPGRSFGEFSKRADYILPQTRFGRSMDERVSINILSKPKPLKNLKLSEEEENPEENPFFLIPYPRPGKRFFGTKPLPPNVKLDAKGKEQLVSQEAVEKEPTSITFLVPYPRPGRSDKGSQSLIPSLRFGRSEQKSMVLYPRPGRSSNKSSQQYMLPYPRLGKSEDRISLIPSVRFGRSSLLPHPRIGKSSNSILPYPRLGRNSIEASTLVFRNAPSMLPYLRFGRKSSASIIPQMRVGKSDGSVLGMLMENFETTNQYLNSPDGKEIYNQAQMNSDNSEKQEKVKGTVANSEHDANSNTFKSAVLVPAKKLQKHMLTETTNYMLPYPRPGRTL